jgi:hypothetical protein
VTANLLIDAETDGCQKTTRIEQALETLQTLMSSVRNGQIGSLDIQLTSAPAIIYTPDSGSGRYDVFARGIDGAIWHKWWEGSWHDWESLGGLATSAPAVASLMYGRLDLFVRGPDGALWHRSYSGAWSDDWGSMGGDLAEYAPAAVSPEQGNIIVFAIGPDGLLWQLSVDFDTYAGLTWGAWQPAARTAPTPTFGITSGPAAIVTDVNLYDVFVRGGNGNLWHSQYTGSWSGWTSLGGWLAPDPGFVPAACSASSSTIDVFAIGIINNDVEHLGWEKASGWGASNSIGGFATQGIGALSTEAGRIDVYVAGPDSKLWHKRRDFIWRDWEGTSGLTLSAPDTFDEEWKWMGSYAPWRAAILVFEHPEDILDPTLRKWQTPAFQRLINDLRTSS